MRGILWGRSGNWLVLRNAEMVKGPNEIVPVDGEVLVDRQNVIFIQLLGGIQ